MTKLRKAELLVSKMESPKTATNEARRSSRNESEWQDFKGQIRQAFGQLTDVDVEGLKSESDLAGLIQQRYGIGIAEAEKRIHGWVAMQKTDPAQTVAHPPSIETSIATGRD